MRERRGQRERGADNEEEARAARKRRGQRGRDAGSEGVARAAREWLPNARERREGHGRLGRMGRMGRLGRFMRQDPLAARGWTRDGAAAARDAQGMDAAGDERGGGRMRRGMKRGATSMR